MAVAFDEPGHQHLVGEAAIEPMLAPAGELRQAAGADDKTVAHGDMGRQRPRRIHGEDLAGLVDRDHCCCLFPEACAS